MNKSITLEIPPVKNSIRWYNSFDKLYHRNTTDVAVHYMIYDPSKNIVIKVGTSKPCGYDKKISSVHAEILALNYCKKCDKRNRYEIYIWKYSKSGNIKSKNSCKLCTDRLKNCNMAKRIFTFENNEKISSIVENPIYSVGYLI